MQIVVCVEQIPDPASIEVDVLTGHVDKSRVVYVTKPPDLRTVEEALSIREKMGGAVKALCVGPSRVEQSLRECLGMGVDRVLRIWGEDWTEEAAPTSVAFALTHFIEENPYDLVLCGDSGSYWQAGQVSAWIAEYLDLPLVTGVTNLRVADDGQGLVVKRKVEKGRRQVLECTLPVLLAVDLSLNEPRDSSLPDLINSLETEVTTADLALDSLLRRSPTAGAMMGKRFQTHPLNPDPHLIFSPDSSLPSQERIAELISGGLADRRGIVVEGEPREVADRIIAFLEERSLLVSLKPEKQDKDQDI